MLTAYGGHSFVTPLSGTVLDIGCYNFEFSKAALEHGASRVIAMDLGPCNNHPDGVTFLRCALGDSTKMVEYIRPKKRNAWHIGGGDSVIRQLSVFDLFTFFQLYKVSLVKLDCERSELSILELLPPGVRQISVEFHLHVWPEDEPRIDGIISRMSERYDIIQHVKTIRKTGEHANYWDTLMVRKC